MLIMMMSDAPLPMPKVVIWSASHITKSEAVVMQTTVIRLNMTGFVPAGTRPAPMPLGRPSISGCSSTVEMPHAWNTQRTIVR